MAVDSSSPEVEAVEAAFEEQRPGQWRRLTSIELEVYSKIRARAGWIVQVPPEAFPELRIDHLLVLVDSSFPWSAPRVVAPQAPSDGTWPHVEAGGYLCLPERELAAGVRDRVLAGLQDACAILSLPSEERRSHLSLEASTYWKNSIQDGNRGPRIFSLLNARGPSREIWCSELNGSGIVVVADDQDVLQRWLSASGQSEKGRKLRRSILLWLDAPLIPAEFPTTNLDLFQLPSFPDFSKYIGLEGRTPVLLGADSEIGPVLIGVTLLRAGKKDIPGGFRRVDQVPWQRILGSPYARNHLKRSAVERVDRDWIHGRGKDPSAEALSGKIVAIVGCGSLGSSIAKLLAQAGVGNFLLIDHDVLAAHNTSRHLLGLRDIGRPKTEAVQTRLSQDFPHLGSIESLEERFEALDEEAIQKLEACDVVVSAGLDISTDLSIDAWRASLQGPPIHVCTWVEAFALAGHAVTLVGGARLLDGFDASGKPRFQLVDWSNTPTQVREAGCGNLFQPHDAANLHFTAALAAQVVLEALKTGDPISRRDSWLGDKALIVARGGKPLTGFTASRTYVTQPWYP